jgi:hypothetical protein
MGNAGKRSDLCHKGAQRRLAQYLQSANGTVPTRTGSWGARSHQTIEPTIKEKDIKMSSRNVFEYNKVGLTQS